MKFFHLAAILAMSYYVSAETCENVVAQKDDTTPCQANGTPSEANLNPFCFSNGIRAAIMRPCTKESDKA